MTDQTAQPQVTMAELCREAVERHGDDWPNIEAYVAARIKDMPIEDRARFDRDMKRMINFCAPSRRGNLHH